jgi:hypothetical protein
MDEKMQENEATRVADFDEDDENKDGQTGN